MNTIGDIVINIIVQVMVPLITLIVSGLLGIASTIFSVQLGAATAPAAGSDTAFSLPLIIFSPGRFYIANNNVCLPVELMAVVCALSVLALLQRAETWEMRAAALFVGVFAPPLIIQFLDLMIYNFNLLLPQMSSEFFAVFPASLMLRAGTLATYIRIIYGDAAEVVSIAATILSLYGGIGISCLFLIRALFHLGGSFSAVIVSLVAIRSLFAGIDTKAMQYFLVFLVVLFIAAILTAACINSFHSLLVYTAAIFHQYSNHVVLQPRIRAFEASVYRYLEVTGGDVAWAQGIVERPANGCDDDCSELLRQQVGAAIGAAVLPLLLSVAIITMAMRWFRLVL